MTARRASAGMTLLEVMIALGLVGVIALAVLRAVDVTFDQQRRIENDLDFDSMSLGMGLFLQSSVNCTSLLPSGLPLPAGPGPLPLPPSQQLGGTNQSQTLKLAIQSLSLEDIQRTKQPREYLASLKLVAKEKASGILHSRGFPVLLRTVVDDGGGERIAECGSGAAGIGASRIRCPEDQVLTSIGEVGTCTDVPYPFRQARDACGTGGVWIGSERNGSPRCFRQPARAGRLDPPARCKVKGYGSCTLSCPGGAIRFEGIRAILGQFTYTYSYLSASSLQARVEPWHTREGERASPPNQEIEFTATCFTPGR